MAGEVDRRGLIGASLLAAVVAAGPAVGEEARVLTPSEAALDAPDPAEVIPLWPAGPPGGERVTAVETVVARPPPAGMRDRAVTGVRNPNLTVFRPARPNGAAVLIIPGGAYLRVVQDKEGHELARDLASRGYVCFVLLYRLPGDHWAAGGDVSLQDAQRAMRIVRTRALGADSFAPDRIAVVGFSAGGHVAGSLITGFEEALGQGPQDAELVSARPDLAILVYPVISMDPGVAFEGLRESLSPPGASEAEIVRRSVERRVRADNPPTFLVHAADDRTVPVANSLLMFQALKAADVAAEMHIFEDGGHGFGLRGLEGRSAAAWPELLTASLRKHGV